MGIDKSIPAPPETAQVLNNWAYDPQTKAWQSNVGYEPYFGSPSQTNGPFTAANGLNKPVDSLYAFQRHNSAQQFILFECGGKLCYLSPQVTAAGDEVVILETDRTIPNPTRERTTYEPFGRYVCITNGVDRPIKFRGDERVFPLGWTDLPGPPSVFNSPTVTVAGNVSTFEAADGFFGPSSFSQSDSTFPGVSSDTDAESVVYFYKVSFVNEAGSESPLSNESNRFKYTADEITRTDTGVPKVVPLMTIPVGPTGTVARRIYRTKSNGDQSLFYLVDTVKNNYATEYTDFREDNQLGPQAPNNSESVPFPAPSGRFTASFKNSLFIDGGLMDPTRLYFSAPLEPDRFKALSYLEVGTREGGDIVGLEAYYNSLLVFRENAIDLVRSRPDGSFDLVPFVEGIGTWSNNTIVAIPNIGIALLSRDGCYLINGGLDGGADLTIKKISSQIDEWFERLAIDLMPSAVGCYSQRDQELHFYVPQSGRPGLHHGLIFHANNGQWSTRSEFPVRCVTVDKDSNVLFGCNEYSGLVNGQEIRRGIYAISRKKQRGVNYLNDALEPGFATTSLFQSQWIDLGEPSLKKYVKYVYVYAITGGDQTVSVTTYKDRDRTVKYTVGDYKWQQGDSADQAVYDTAVWDTAQWEDRRLAMIRFPVAMHAVQDFSFTLETTNSIHFVGYALEFNVDGAKAIGGKR